MKYWLIIKYDGTNYYGYATQPHKKTIQDTLELGLSQLFNEEIKTRAASRTDRFVHALGQSITFISSKEFTKEKLQNALNCILPNDILIDQVQIVDDEFDNQKDVKSKEYHYQLSQKYDLFQRNYVVYYKQELNLFAMKKAANYLLGNHDFRSFCSKKSGRINFQRTIFKLEIIEQNEEIKFIFLGDGFLYNMIRIIVGTLLEVGQEKITPEEVKMILKAKNRKYAKKTAPAHGLYLVKINY